MADSVPSALPVLQAGMPSTAAAAVPVPEKLVITLETMDRVKAMPREEWESILQQIESDMWHIQSQMPEDELPDGWLDQLVQVTVEVIRASRFFLSFLLHPAKGSLLR
jgi:hypothetical protein